jgi:Amt family ammonium transporter
LVAITPAAGYVPVGASIFIGAAAAAISNYAVSLRSRFTLDDTLDVFPCHGVGGMFGMIATGVFANDVGLIHGNPKTFLMHLAALGVVTVFTLGGSLVLYKLTDLIIPMRVSLQDETLGLDMSQHGETMEGGLPLYVETADVTAGVVAQPGAR